VRIRPWLAKTHSKQSELVRHFFSQQLSSQLTSSDQAQRFLVAIFVVLAGVGPLVVRMYMPKYGYLQSLPTPGLYLAAVRADRLFFVSLSMTVVGFITALHWENLFPGRLDYLTLKSLPVRLYQVFIARFLAAFTIAAVVVLDLNFSASVLFPLLTSGRWQTPAFGFSYVFAHAVATMGAGLFIFFAITAVQGFCLNLFSPRAFARLSEPMQAFFVTTFVAVGPYVIDMPNWYAMIAARPNWMSFFPPAWFLGLYEKLLGTHELYFVRLSKISVWAMAAGIVGAFAAYSVTYRRSAGRVLEESLRIPNRESSRTIGALNAFCNLLIRDPHDRAVFDFSIRILQRNRRHRLLVGYTVGAALVVALEAVAPIIIAKFRSGEPWYSWQLESIAAAPLIVGVVLISAFRYVFQLPAELQANWIFRMANGPGLLNSVERLLVLCGVLPAVLVTLPVEVLPFGRFLTFAHATLSAALLLLFIEMGLREWRKIPFTCSYLPGRRNLWATIGAYFIVFAVAIPAMAHFEVWLHQPFLLFGVASGLSILYLKLRSTRRNQWKIVSVLFDESEEPQVESLRLSPN